MIITKKLRNLEHLAEEERSSRSQGATDSEDEYDGVATAQMRYSLGSMPSKRRIVLLILELIFINLLVNSLARCEKNAKSSSRSNNGGRGSRTELKEIDEEPESEDDDFDIEASPRQIAKNRLKVGFKRQKSNFKFNFQDGRITHLHPSPPEPSRQSRRLHLILKF